ncbi:hypothetical protein Golax_017975 [Gossypium laxum]|uniref:Uncharacterized protein n=1 Tax=Gossypium laxum TaxID=34288 RepID=A0A7J8Z1V0_9ROSI|nr:hypothetical protein [Gossypium laxum]
MYITSFRIGVLDQKESFKPLQVQSMQKQKQM